MIQAQVMPSFAQGHNWTRADSMRHTVHETGDYSPRNRELWERDGFWLSIGVGGWLLGLLLAKACTA